MAKASTIDRVTASNYRCFREKQTVRLAPLTLLVGENSTGKTSFLALIRALWDVAVRETVPDFKEYPYDLGTFHEVAHYRGTRGGSAGSFEAGFTHESGVILAADEASDNRLSFDVTFADREGVPFPVGRRVGHGNAWVELCQANGDSLSATFGAASENWALPDHLRFVRIGEGIESIKTLLHWHVRQLSEASDDGDTQKSVSNWGQIDRVIVHLHNIGSRQHVLAPQRPFASAPVRSRPRRTYDPTQRSRDPEGVYVPTLLDSIARRGHSEWQRLKAGLQAFGAESGLFDEIAVKALGNADGSPFQIQIRKYGGKRKERKGPHRNLVDVGYGVSQALPILTEILRADSPQMFLLQQPEVHLHPSAQAALGSLFCEIATARQLVVETHSDHLVDRIRMDVRDRKTDLQAEDVSILFFEPGEIDVTIHSLRLDDDGNVLDAPPTYRRFFMDEMRRSIGL